MHTSGDGTDVRQHGSIPKRHDATERPLIEQALGRFGGGLEPLRMEPPRSAEGLAPISFTDGLTEIDVTALRSNGGRVHVHRGVGENKMLQAAARRATELDLLG